MTRLPPGTEVGAERWPLSAAHPDCWGLPWKGVVLSAADPRAWRETLAFPRREPNATAVREHLARHPLLGASRVPVLWEFGEIHWEPADGLRPYAEDVAAWALARRAAFARTSVARAA